MSIDSPKREAIRCFALVRKDVGKTTGSMTRARKTRQHLPTNVVILCKQEEAIMAFVFSFI